MPTYVCVYWSSPSYTRSILTTYVVHVHGSLSTHPWSVLTALTSVSSRPPSSPSPPLQLPVSGQKSLVAHKNMYYIAIVFLQYNCDSLSVFICSLNTASYVYRCALSIHCFKNLYVQPCLTLYASVLAIYGSYVASWLLLFFLCIESHGKREVRKAPPSGGVEDTARRHIASELLQTERNFVNILNIIVKVCRVSIQYSNHSILLYICNQMLKLCDTDTCSSKQSPAYPTNTNGAWIYYRRF